MSFQVLWSGNPLSTLVECGLVGVFTMLGFYGACLTVHGSRDANLFVQAHT
jgi:hypothetical protein